MRTTSAARYLEALRSEIGKDAPFSARTIFLGGGTPNTYTAAQIGALVDLLRKRFDVTGEISIEVNPELVSRDDCFAYARAGINRVSIGVQSLIPAEIAVLGRKHRIEDVKRALDWLRAAGIPSISLDLIFAVPGQTVRSWAQTLRAAVAMEPEHISTYGLTVEDGTPYATWREREPDAFFDDAAEADFYEEAIDILGNHGYEHYENE